VLQKRRPRNSWSKGLRSGNFAAGPMMSARSAFERFCSDVVYPYFLQSYSRVPCFHLRTHVVAGCFPLPPVIPHGQLWEHTSTGPRTPLEIKLPETMQRIQDLAEGRERGQSFSQEQPVPLRHCKSYPCCELWGWICFVVFQVKGCVLCRTTLLACVCR